MRFSIKNRVKSFKYAFNGIYVMIRTQHNAWIHAFATIVVIFLGFLFNITRQEWCWIVLAIILVWTAEAINTAFEFLADATSNEVDPLIGKAKDVAAGAVLITAIGAVIIGILVLGPYVVHFF